MRNTLPRRYEIPKVLSWLSHNEFVGQVDRPGRAGIETLACYGWSKGAGFFIYTISDGHIEKIGSIDRQSLLDKNPNPMI